MIRSLIFIFLILSFLCSCGKKKQEAAPPPLEKKAKISGKLSFDNSGGPVRLRWCITKWPRGLQGFMLERRSSSTSNFDNIDWQAISANPIVGNYDLNRDLSEVQSNPKEQRRLKESFGSWFGDKSVERTTKAQTLTSAGYANISTEDLNWVNVTSGFIFDAALYLGQAYVDNDFQEQNYREYRLLPVWTEPNPSVEIIIPDVVVPPHAEIIITPTVLEAKYDDSYGVYLKFGFNSEQFDKFSLVKCKIYRAGPDEVEFTSIIKGGLRGGKVMGQQRIFIYKDKKAKGLYGKLKYRIFSENEFGEVYTNDFVQEVHAVPPEALSEPVPRGAKPHAHTLRDDFSISNVSSEGIGEVDISFDIDPEFAQFTGRFELVRFDVANGSGENGKGFPLTISDIQNGVFVDDGEFVNGGDYGYALRFISGVDQVVSAVRPFKYYKAPVKPSALRGKWVLRGGRGLVKLQWSPKVQADDATKYYILEHDEMTPGRMLSDSSVGHFTGNSVEYPLANRSDKVITFRLVPVGLGNREGKSAEVVINCPGFKLPHPRSIKYREHDGMIRISWEYDQLSHLLGFRIYANGKLLAGEQKVDAKSRFYDLNRKQFSDQLIEVQAVSRHGMISEPMKKQLALAPPKSTLPKRPASFTSQWHHTKDQMVTLSWKPKASGPSINAWDLYADIKALDKIVLLQTGIPGDKGSIDVVVPSGKRTYNFKLVGVSASGRRTGPILTKLAPPGAVLPGFKLSGPLQEKGTKTSKFSWYLDSSLPVRGFQVFLNGKLLLDENILGADSRSFEFTPLDNGKHLFSIRAVASGGSTSEMSPVLEVFFNDIYKEEKE